MNYFHWADYIVFCIMLLASLGIGVFSAFHGAKHRETTTADYLMGNKQLSLGPVALSICVSMISANTLVGVPAETYGFGIGYMLFGVIVPLSGIILAVTLVQVIYPLGVVSIHEYLQMRFKSPTLKWYGAVIQIILQILYVGTVLYGPAISLEISTGVPTWISLILTCAIGISYTSVGGMKAVVWTDTFQCIIMVAGMFAMIVIGCVKVGGVAEVIEINREWGRFQVNTSADPTQRITVWSGIVGGLFLGMSMLGANQPCMQRTCTLKNLNMARWSAVIGSTMMGVFIYMSTTVGFVIFAYYTALGCDPVESGELSTVNQILPFYIMDVLNYPGLPGLLFSSLFSGALSSLSSSINSMSAVMWKDVMEPYFPDWTETRKTHCNKVLTLIFGLCCLASSFVMLFVGGSLVAVAASVLGAVLGPLLGVFFLAALVPFCNWRGALFGGIVSAGINIWMLCGMVVTETQVTPLPSPTSGCAAPFNLTNLTTTLSPSWTSPMYLDPNTTLPGLDSSNPSAEGTGLLTWMYSVSFIWYPFIGVVISMVLGVIVSLLTGYTKYIDLDDPNLVASYVYCGPKAADIDAEYDYKPPERDMNDARDAKELEALKEHMQQNGQV